MSDFQLSKKSLALLEPVHFDLRMLALRAIKITPYDFGILCGIRTKAEQAQRLTEGVTQTTRSMHFEQEDGKSHAIDIAVYVDGKYINGDTPEELGYYRKVVQAFFTVAIEEGIQIEAGALWRTFVDAGHIQLGRKYRR